MVELMNKPTRPSDLTRPTVTTGPIVGSAKVYDAPEGAAHLRVPFREIRLTEAAKEPRWAATLAGVGLSDDAVKPVEWYVRRLRGLGCAVDAWETTYMQILHGENPVLEWVRGTALRPLLKALPASLHDDFLTEYGARLLEAYPPQPFGTLLPFKRVFFVARRMS